MSDNTNHIVISFDFLTGEETKFEATQEDIDAYKLALLDFKAVEDKAKEVEDARESAKAKLSQLGLTETEISAMLNL